MGDIIVSLNANTLESASVTGEKETKTFTAQITAIAAYAAGVTVYTLDSSTDIKNLSLDGNVTITGCTNTVNNGTFQLVSVDRANYKVSLVNVNGVVEAAPPAAATFSYSYDIVKLHTNAASGGTSSITGTTNTFEVNPLSDQYLEQSLVDTTNVSADTHYYPATTGNLLGGFKDISFSGKLIDADGTLTVTVEVTNDEDSTNADWIQVYIYDDKNNSVVNSITVTNGTLTFGLSANNINYRSYRVKVVASGATNTVIVKERRKAL